jgi:ABC-type sugar transport system substrate-binding protein
MGQKFGRGVPVRTGTSARVLAGTVAAATLALSLGACGSSDDGGAAAAGAGSGSSGKPAAAKSVSGKTVVLLAGENSNTWAGAFNRRFETQLAAQGVKVKPLLTLSPTEQVQQFREAIAQKPDAIAVELLDTKATVLPIKQAKQAGVPVIAFDGPPDPSVRGDVRTVESDNAQLGQLAAENLVEGLKAQGKEKANIVAIGGLKAMLLTQQRTEAFEKVMAQHPDYKVLETTDSQWNPTVALQQAQQLFAKHGKDNVDAAYGMSDYLAIPIIQAAKRAGIKVGGKDGLLVVSGNCFKSGIAAIRAGELYGTNTEDPETIANQTAKYVTDLLGGADPPQHTKVAEERITKANVEKYAAQCSKA